MKPSNFPEAKRQRQMRALARLRPTTITGKSNAAEIAALTANIAAGSQRDVRTKKDRSAGGRFSRA